MIFNNSRKFNPLISAMAIWDTGSSDFDFSDSGSVPSNDSLLGSDWDTGSSDFDFYDVDLSNYNTGDNNTSGGTTSKKTTSETLPKTNFFKSLWDSITNGVKMAISGSIFGTPGQVGGALIGAATGWKDSEKNQMVASLIADNPTMTRKEAEAEIDRIEKSLKDVAEDVTQGLTPDESKYMLEQYGEGILEALDDIDSDEAKAKLDGFRQSASGDRQIEPHFTVPGSSILTGDTGETGDTDGYKSSFDRYVGEWLDVALPAYQKQALDIKDAINLANTGIDKRGQNLENKLSLFDDKTNKAIEEQSSLLGGYRKNLDDMIGDPKGFKFGMLGQEINIIPKTIRQAIEQSSDLVQSDFNNKRIGYNDSFNAAGKTFDSLSQADKQRMLNSLLSADVGDGSLNARQDLRDVAEIERQKAVADTGAALNKRELDQREPGTLDKIKGYMSLFNSVSDSTKSFFS